MPYHWPSHKYLGQGTSDFTQTPVDKDDDIAREHDLDYSFAVSGNEIHDADRHAIGEFWSDFTRTGNVHSLVGSVGLGLKYGAESIFNKTLYPRMNSSSINKAIYSLRQRYLSRYAREHNISYQEAQRNQREILNSSEDYQSQLNELDRSFNNSNTFERASDRLNRQRGLDQPLDSSTQVQPGPSDQRSPPNNIHDEDTLIAEDYFEDMNIFNNVNTQAMDVVDAAGEQNRQGGSGSQTVGGEPSVMGQAPQLQILHNPNIKPQTITIRHSHLFQTWGYKFSTWENTTVNKSYLLHYPMAVLPVDFLPFYLSPSEFENLPKSCYIEEVFVKVTPKGIRCCFDTGASLSSTANNQQTIFGISSVGLNHKYLIRPREIKHNATKPMEPTYDVITMKSIIEFADRLWGPKTVKFPNIQFPTCLWAIRSLPFYTSFHFPFEGNTDHKDVPCINYSYKPKFSPCKVKQNVVGTDNIVLGTDKWIGNNYTVKNTTVTIDGGKVESTDSNVSWEQDNDYTVPLEQATYKTTPQHVFHCTSQPQVHIGILPVQRNASSDVGADFVNASAIFYVETEIVLTTDINSMFNRANIACHMDSVYDRKYKVSSLYNIEHYSGMLNVT